MSSLRVYFLLLQDFSQWKGTYGGLIRLDLHRDESPTDGCCDPTNEKGKPEDCARKKEGRFTKDTSADLDPGGFCLSTWTLTLEGT
jgi:hypothetical protein